MIATGVSLVLTWALLFLCLAVCHRWRSAAADLLADRNNPIAWFAGGVFIHFATNFADNLYWGVAWSAHFGGWASEAALFENGVYSNIPFRQIGTIAAAFCHLKAAALYANKDVEPYIMGMVAAASVGILYIAAIA